MLSGLLYAIVWLEFSLWQPAWFCFVPLLWVLRGAKSWKRAFFLSWWAGIAANLVGYHWIIHLLETFAHLATPLATLGYVLLCIGQGASVGFIGWLAWLLAKRSPLSLAGAFPIALVSGELLFPLLFPSYVANTQVRMPWVTQIADLGGVLLVSALIGWVNAAIYSLIAARAEGRRLPWRMPAAAAGALALTVAYGALRIAQMDARDAAAPKLKTAIVQANVGAAAKHRDVDEGTRRYRRMTDEAMRIPDVGLVVWPESGLNRPVSPRNKNLQGLVASEVKAPMIIGALRVEPNPDGRRKVWNSSLALAPGGDIVASYDKIELLAFGEYVPGDRYFPQIYDWLPYTSHFQRGESTSPLPAGDYLLSTDICYEDILPSFIRKLMGPIDDDGTRPHAMVNLTNDSWYGPVEPYIHLSMATFRSIEHRRWLIRSTATGISAFIDSSGRVVRQSGFETEEILVEDVPMITAGPTIYGRIGDLFGWLCAAAAAGGIAWPRLRRRPQADARDEAAAA